jgi:hypothetical protein
VTSSNAARDVQSRAKTSATRSCGGESLSMGTGYRGNIWHCGFVSAFDHAALTSEETP